MQMLLLAADAPTGEHTGLDLILPGTAELVWGIVCFAVVAFVLVRVAFPKIREAVESRERAIQEANEGAESTRAEAQRELDEYKKQLADARGEANRIIEEARQQAESVRKDLTAKAEAEAKQITAKAEEQLEAERGRTIQELQSTISELSIQLAEKIVNRSIDADAQKDLVDAYIKELAGANGGGR